MGLFAVLKRLIFGEDKLAEFDRQYKKPADPVAPKRAPVKPSPRPAAPQPGGRSRSELAEWLGLPLEQLDRIPVAYRTFSIPKHRGGRRQIDAPADEFKQLQRRILRRVLRKLSCHPAAMGFERGCSIATHALGHTRKAVVVRMDVKDFFPSTTEQRVRDYFERIGWQRDAAAWLTKICTHRGALPQGAPTSPRLSNLVNTQLDARLTGLARRYDACYSRYADDLTFSFVRDEPQAIRDVIRATKHILADHGYTLHQKKKLHIRRRHQQQRVTGLVVNDRVNLPRRTRRRLRAIEHRINTGRPVTMSESQFDGWVALQDMVEQQTHV